MGERAEKINTGAGKTLRLALVDSDVAMHTEVRRHLAEVQPVWCFDAFTCGNEALKAMQAAPPQVVLLEQTLPGGCGIDYTRRFKTHLPDLPVVIFTAHGKPENLMSALLAGARGYVVKNGSLTGLVPQLQKAMSGRLALCEQAERLLPEAFARLGQGNPWGLTHREQEAMLWLCRHKSDKEISAAMGLATSTAHVHLMRAFKKLGVHDRRAAIGKYLPTIARGGGGGKFWHFSRLLKRMGTTPFSTPSRGL